MGFPTSGVIWMNGALVNWADAKIHVASHVIHYGSGIFEGARCYDTPKGSACFRLDAHTARLYNSAKIYRMPIPMEPAAMNEAIFQTIRANDFKGCYIRPLVYRGYGEPGVSPLASPVEVAILCWEWGAYLGPEALEKGVDVRVSSWTRAAPNTFPTMAKSSANYASSGLIKMEAQADGYAEGIALDVNGHVSEGSAQNIFMVRNGVLYTPPLHASVLPGITRDSIMVIAQDLGYEVREDIIPREALYIADELFFVGTAAEVTPIRSVDRASIGAGRCGPVTRAIQLRFFEIVNGEVPDTHRWLQYLNPPAPGTEKTDSATTVGSRKHAVGSRQ
jgi:branched-chain amino acid aminotransferase